MKKGKYQKARPARSTGSKMIAMTLALVLLIGGVVGGTLAWFTDYTPEVKNTFTVGQIGVNLEETEREYKMIPGWYMDKDPNASVTENSVDCYLFVEVAESANFKDFMTYEIAEGWTKLEEGVYYRIFDSRDTDNSNVKGTAYPILGKGSYTDKMGTESVTTDDVTVTWADNQVGVKPSVTEEMMEALTEDTYPTLTFQAYAVQLYKDNTNQFSAEEAWEQANA